MIFSGFVQSLDLKKAFLDQNPWDAFKVVIRAYDYSRGY